MREALGFFLGCLARAWLATLRVRLVVDPALDAARDRPWVLVFFHGTQWPLLAWRRRRPTLVMVSHSKDGAMQVRALSVLGFRIVRGSSSRGGAKGLAAIIRRLKKDDVDAAFAVDGPRGPYGRVAPGAALAAARARGVLVPMGAGVTRAHVFERAWDRFVLAWPFTRVAVVLGPPLESDGVTAARIHEAIATANARASEILAHGKGPVLPSRSSSAVGAHGLPSARTR